MTAHTFVRSQLLLACFIFAFFSVSYSASAQQLEEVIVTAQKREQSLQQVSIPVTAIGMARLETNQVFSFEQLQYIAPTLSFSQSFGSVRLFIRGIGLSDTNPGIDPSVALHVDGAVINDATAHYTSLFDLERVEVLRGPQGIIYGRNATGGAVNLITAKPTRELEGYANLTYGSENLFVLEGAVSGPLGDVVSGRLAFRGLTRDGYGVNEVTGNDVHDAEQFGGRAHLLFDFTDDVSFLATGEYYKEDDSALGHHFKRETFPQFRDPAFSGADQRVLAPLGISTCCPAGPDGYPVGERNYASEFDPINQKDTWSLTGTLDIQLNDQFSLVNITNYREVEGFFSYDFDGSGIVSRYDVTGNPPTILSRTVDSQQFTNEFQIHYADDNLNALVALYYFDQDMQGTTRSGLTPFGGLPVPGLETQRVFLTGEGKSKSWSVFGNITWDVSEQFSLKLGARYTEEDRGVDNDNRIQVFLNPAWTPRPLSAIRNFPVNPTFSDQKDTDNFSPMVGVEWRPNENIMAYYTYSEGFKSAVGQLSQTANDIVLPEEIQNHELGLKSTLADGSLVLNLAAFSYELDNMQLGRTLPAPGGGTGFVNLFENAAKTEGKGIEVDLVWQLSEQFQLTGAASWLDVEFTEFDTVNNFDPCLVLTSCNPPVLSLAGNTPRSTPEWAYNIHGAYDFPLENGGLITLTADISYKDEQFFSEFNNDVEGTGSFTMLDASLTWTAADERWFARLWGKNLTDELVEAGSFAVSLSRTVGRTWQPPRTGGVTVGISF